MAAVDDELMPIGRFAQISGLSIHTLRHYDDVRLLVPAEVDPTSGYRRYRRSQARVARFIKALRCIELPIEEVRAAIADDAGTGLTEILRNHRQRLKRQQRDLELRVADVDYYLEKGIPMAPITRARPVQLKISVDDTDAAIAFYHKAFGFHYDVTRRTEDAEYSSFMFSRYGEADFFLLHLIADDDQMDRPGPATFGLLVEDLGEAHQRALDAGATEVVAPHDAVFENTLKNPNGGRQKSA